VVADSAGVPAGVDAGAALVAVLDEEPGGAVGAELAAGFAELEQPASTTTAAATASATRGVRTGMLSLLFGHPSLYSDPPVRRGRRENKCLATSFVPRIACSHRPAPRLHTRTRETERGGGPNDDHRDPVGGCPVRPARCGSGFVA
jgi:hypothetical protein